MELSCLLYNPTLLAQQYPEVIVLSDGFNRAAIMWYVWWCGWVVCVCGLSGLCVDVCRVSGYLNTSSTMQQHKGLHIDVQYKHVHPTHQHTHMYLPPQHTPYPPQTGLSHSQQQSLCLPTYKTYTIHGSTQVSLATKPQCPFSVKKCLPWTLHYGVPRMTCIYKI